MDAFEIAELSARRKRQGRTYLEFLRVSTMSGGLYALPKAAMDPQSPHTEDEVYVVTGGRARIRVGSEDRDVQSGSVVFVPARVEHRFHDIAEDLTALVFFAPAERKSGA
ncbi:MAG TPA: cupin domain-containing protein [Thermoplasmata archaeon]